MEPNMENPFMDNPNFLVISIDERLRQIKEMMNRAGIMISVEALLATFIFLLHENEHFTWGVKLYLLVLPLTFVSISFFLHLSVFFKGSTLFPFEFIVFFARQERLAPPTPTEQNSAFQEQLNIINKSFNRKANSMNYGYSFFSISFVLLILVNLTSSAFIESQFHTDGVIAVITVLLAVVGCLLATIFKFLFFVPTVRKLSLNILPPSAAQQLQISLEPIQQTDLNQPAAIIPEQQPK